MKEMKHGMRGEIKSKVAALTPEGLHAKSLAIEKRFLESSEFESADSILIYVAMKTEPETRNVIKRALELKKKVYAPKVEGDFVCVCQVHGLEKLKPGKFGIHEPPGETKCAQREFSIVIVPGLAFDLNGNRLGRGGGFYDRLLSSTRAEFVAFAFDEQVVKKVPTQEHDVKVHKIFTDKRVIECRR